MDMGDGGDGDRGVDGVRRGPERVALAGVFLNTALAATKLFAGLLGNSYALVADAVESMGDILGSLVIWGALRYGSTPPDDEHPFGHGKAESLAALAVALLLMVAGVGIAGGALLGLREAQEPPAAFALVVLAVVVVVKEGVFRLTRRSAMRAGSSAGHADAWHHRADAITSGTALVGVSIAVFGGGGWAAADEVAALVAAVIIVINGVRLVREPYRELMDEAAPDVGERCASVVLAIDGIRAIERCDARKVGRGYRVVMHAEVDADMRVADAHDLTGVAKRMVRERMGEVDSLLIHIEPHEGS